MLDRHLKVKEHLQKDENVVNWYATPFRPLTARVSMAQANR